MVGAEVGQELCGITMLAAAAMSRSGGRQERARDGAAARVAERRGVTVGAPPGCTVAPSPRQAAYSSMERCWLQPARGPVLPPPSSRQQRQHLARLLLQLRRDGGGAAADRLELRLRGGGRVARIRSKAWRARAAPTWPQLAAARGSIFSAVPSTHEAPPLQHPGAGPPEGARAQHPPAGAALCLVTSVGGKQNQTNWTSCEHPPGGAACG